MTLNYHDTPIYYSISGNGPVLVLLHGFLESSTMWKVIVSEFEISHTVVTLDFPGHGKSGVVAETHTMELFADVTYELLKFLNIEEGTFVGHSMGGYVLMAMAERHPEVISKLILLNSTPAEDSEERKTNRERALQLVPKAKNAFVSMAISNLFTQEVRESYASEIEQLKKEALQFPLKGIIAAIKGMLVRKDRTPILENFDKEKFMICGEEDPIVSITECEKIAETSKTKLFNIDGGHMSWMENTVKIVKILYLIENNYT